MIKVSLRKMMHAIPEKKDFRTAESKGPLVMPLMRRVMIEIPPTITKNVSVSVCKFTSALYWCTEDTIIKSDPCISVGISAQEKRLTRGVERQC